MSPYTLALAARSQHPQCAEYVQGVWAQSWEDSCRQLPFTANGDIHNLIIAEAQLLENGRESPLTDGSKRMQSENSSDSHVYADVKVPSPYDHIRSGEAAVAGQGNDDVSLTSGASMEMDLYDLHTRTTVSQGLESRSTSRGPSRRSSANLHHVVGFNYGPEDVVPLPRERQDTVRASRDHHTDGGQVVDAVYAKIIPKHQRIRRDNAAVQTSPQEKQDEGVQTSLNYRAVKRSTVSLGAPGKMPMKSWAAGQKVPQPPPLPLPPAEGGASDIATSQSFTAPLPLPPAEGDTSNITSSQSFTAPLSLPSAGGDTSKITTSQSFTDQIQKRSVIIRDISGPALKEPITTRGSNQHREGDNGWRDVNGSSLQIAASAGKASQRKRNVEGEASSSEEGVSASFDSSIFL